MHAESADEAGEDATSPGSLSNLKVTLAVTGTELAFIDDLLQPDPVAVVIKVRHGAYIASPSIRYDTRCCFNVRSKADMSQLNLPHGTNN